MLQLRKPPLFSVALISAAALAYEILLMRLLSIIHWHHFAYMIISVALLGYGASGTFLSLSQNRLKGKFGSAFMVNAVLFGLTSVACYAVAQSLPFNALELLWDPWQPLWLVCIYLLLFIPFFCAANCICLCFSEFPQHMHRVYSFDLLGAGLGGLLAIALLFLLMPATTLRIIALLGLLSAFVAMLELRKGSPAWKFILLVIFAIVVASTHGLSLKLSQFKGLSQAMNVPGASIVDRRSGPLGLLTTVESPAVPFRHAPGLSLNAPGEPPAQLAIFTDGDGMSVITAHTGPPLDLDYLDYVTSAVPYHILKPALTDNTLDVLVLGAGGGSNVLQALHLGASRVDAVEVNAQLLRLVRQEFGDFSGFLYDDPRVSVHIAEARGFVAASRQQWDLIQIALLDSFGASAAGLHALSENYLYTVQAFSEYLRRLRPGGILASTRWIKLPPRDGLKMIATAAAALRESGIENPGDHLVMIRGWNTSTLLARNQPFSSDDIERIRTFCRERWFDLVWYPGIKESETNQYIKLQQAWFYRASESLLDERRETFFSEYKFNIRPATDDRPYFFHFLKWRSLPEIISLRGQGGLPLLEQGYLILVATLLQAALASLLLILLPLYVNRLSRQREPRGLWRVFVYFLAIGFAFMLIEIAFIQKFILFLSHPLYAVAVVLSSFLLFAGLGSAVSGKWNSEARVLRIVLGIAVLAILYIFLLPPLFQQLISLPDIVKIIISAMLIAPLAFLMGMPFPLGLSRVAQLFPERVPWAWGINGCASVMGAVLATLMAIHAGFQLVVIAAVLLYFLAAVSTPKSRCM
jgi:SAM-dependent methyltransferase